MVSHYLMAYKLLTPWNYHPQECFLANRYLKCSVTWFIINSTNQKLSLHGLNLKTKTYEKLCYRITGEHIRNSRTLLVTSLAKLKLTCHISIRCYQKSLRSIHSQAFFKKVFLKISQNSQNIISAGVSFWIKLLTSATLLKKSL